MMVQKNGGAEVSLFQLIVLQSIVIVAACNVSHFHPKMWSERD